MDINVEQELIRLLWLIFLTLNASLCYFIARDRAPEKAFQAIVWGYLLGPIGVGVAFLITRDEKPPTSYEQPHLPETPPVSEIKANLQRLRAKLNT